MKFDLNAAEWLYPPKSFEIGDEIVKIVTDPGTDFWQRSYYGFRNDKAPALLLESSDKFTFTAKVSFTAVFDQFKLEPCRWQAHAVD